MSGQADSVLSRQSTTAARFAGSCARCMGPVYEGLTHHCGTAVPTSAAVPDLTPHGGSYAAAQVALSKAVEACQGLSQGPALTKDAVDLLALYVRQAGEAVDRAR